MRTDTLVYILISCGVAIFGVIGYFLKRSFSDIDKCKVDIEGIKETYITKDEFKDSKDDLKEKLDKVSSDVEGIKSNYIKQDDFYRAQSNTDQKLQRIYDILLEMKGDK
jgi:hypothetical protein